MIEVKMTIYSGSEWTHKDDTQVFKDENELHAFIRACKDCMDVVEVYSIKKIEK